jgi:hypothetical protein
LHDLARSAKDFLPSFNSSTNIFLSFLSIIQMLIYFLYLLTFRYFITCISCICHKIYKNTIYFVRIK